MLFQPLIFISIAAFDQVVNEQEIRGGSRHALELIATSGQRLFRAFALGNVDVDPEQPARSTLFVCENSRLSGDPALHSVGTNDTKFKIERSLVLGCLLHRGFNSDDVIWMNSSCPILVFAAEASGPQTVKLLLRGRLSKLIGN